MPRNGNWISRNEAAAILGVSPQSVTNYADKGLIQVRETRRYPLYWKPEVEVLAANPTFQEAGVIQNRAEQIKRQAEDLCNVAQAEYSRRQQQFSDAFGTLFPNKEHLYNNLERYRFLLCTLIDGAGIGSEYQSFLKGVLNGKTPERICSEFGFTSGYFKVFYRKALKSLVGWYAGLNTKINSLQATVTTMQVENKELQKENQLLAEALKDQERDEAIRTAASAESKLKLILRTCHPYNVRLRDVGLSVRAFNCAKSNGIETVGQLAQLSRNDVFKWRNTGRKSVAELEELLAGYGLTFGHYPIAAINPPEESATEPAGNTERTYPPGNASFFEQEPWTWPLTRTGMSARLVRLFKENGTTTLGQLASMSRDNIRSIPGLGEASFREAVRTLRRFDVQV